MSFKKGKYVNTEAIDQHMPYAPPSAVMDVIRRFRERGLTEPVTSNTLQQVGVSPGNAARTLQAVKFLGFVDDEGSTTSAFQRLRKANTDEYPDTLAEVLRGVYLPVFNIVDPAQDDLTQIDDAFRGFKPDAQRQRMVKLFLGLCHEAGIVSEDKAPRTQASGRQQKSSQRSNGQQGQGSKSTRKAPAAEEPPPRQEARKESGQAVSQYPLVQAVVEQLPKDGVWTQKRRDLWVQAMTSAIDLAVEVQEPEEVYEGEVMPDLELR